MFKPRWTIVAMSLMLQPAFVATGAAQIVNTLRGFDEKELGWTGGVEGTASIAVGNSEYLEVRVAAAVQYQTETHRWRLIGRNMRLTASGTKQAESRMGHLRHNCRFSRWLASVAFVQGHYDPFRRIEKRILLGAGGRFDLVRDRSWSAALGATFMREDEVLTRGAGGFDTDYRFSFFTSLYHDVARGVDIDMTGFYQPLAEDFSDSRALADVAVRSDITGNLYVLFNYSLEYDSRPPQGVKESDQTLRSGLGYKF